MNLQKTSSAAHLDKWASMLSIVNENLQKIQPDLAISCKKLFFKRLIMENILVFFIQYSGLILSFYSLFSTPLWFATGTACAYLFLRGYSVLPGIWFGSFFACYFSKAGFLLACGFATLFSLQAVLLRWFHWFSLYPTLIFYNLQSLFRFFIYTVLLTALVSMAFVGMVYSAFPLTERLALLWLQWWLANWGAMLIFSCALLTWDAYFPSFYSIKQFDKKQYIAYALLILCLIGLVFSQDTLLTLGFAVLNLFIILFISSLWGWVGAVAALCLSGIWLNFAAFLEAPVFSTPFSSATQLFLQGLLCTESIFGFCFATRSK